MNGKARRSKTRPAPTKPEVYPNAPLVEVVFEIRFAGEPAVECRRDEFFALVRQDFPNLWVPNIEIGKAPALQPYHFKSEDDKDTLMVAINRLAYATRDYQGFRAFAPRALRLTRRFCSFFKLTSLKRTGLRYIDVIPFVREGGTIPWGRYFTIELRSPAILNGNFVNMSLAFESRYDGGSLTTRIACAQSPDESKEVFILDFDFAKTGPLAVAKLQEYLSESHDRTKRVFDAILTEDYKAVMRGEVVE